MHAMLISPGPILCQPLAGLAFVCRPTDDRLMLFFLVVMGSHPPTAMLVLYSVLCLGTSVRDVARPSTCVCCLIEWALALYLY